MKTDLCRTMLHDMGHIRTNKNFVPSNDSICAPNTDWKPPLLSTKPSAAFDAFKRRHFRASKSEGTFECA